VLLITVDTLRPDYLSWAGYDRPTSPFVDSLLARGLVFRRAITPIPRTTPALASLMTGTYPHTHGVRRLLDRLGPRLPTLASLARARGRSTLAVVSNHILTDERGLERGFDVYDFAPDVRDAAATTRAALERLEAYDPSDDLLVWVHYIDPHVPYYPPPELAETFDPGYAGRYRLHFGSAPGGIGSSAYPSDLSKEQAVFRNRLSPELNAHIRRLYAADIRSTDEAIKTLVEACRERFGPDWTIVFSADHGEALGEKDFYFDHGDYLYNGSLQIPFAIVLPPDDPLHRVGVVEDWVSLIDVAPTLIELLGLQRHDPVSLEGRSLVPYLRGESLPRRSLFAESGMSYYKQLIHRRTHFGVRGRFRSVIRGNWKLIFTPEQRTDRAFELYDLAADPTEQRDLYRPDHPAVPDLARDIEQWLRAAPEPERAPSETDLARLRALSSPR
jgi:arylsulfatase A-like enzyme